MKKVFLVPLFCLALAVPSFSQSQKSSRGEAYLHFAKARMLAESGRVNDAIAEYKKALEFDPDNSSIYAEMAETYLRSQPSRMRDALAAAQNAVKLDRNNGDAHKILASIYTSMIGDTNGRAVTEDTVNLAIHEFEEIVRLDPSDRQSFLMLGRLYQIKNDDKKAEEIYKKFLGMEPGSEDGVTALARLHMDANDHKQAVELLEGFIKDHPDADGALEALGQAYANLEQFDKAADAYKKALSVDPDNDDLKRALAQALFFGEQFDEAARLYLEVLKENPTDGMALLRLGQIYREQKRYAQAHVYLQQAVKNFPDSIEIQFNMMLVERDEGLLEDAFDRIADIVRRTERANGSYSESEKQNRRVFLTNQAQISETLGRYDAEIKALTDLKAVSPNTDGRIDRSIVDAYRAAKNTDKALTHCEQALKQNPDSVPLRLAQADMLAEKGRVDDAIRSLRDLTKGAPQDLEVLVAMANIYQRAKKNDEALAIAESIIKQFPNDANAYFQQGAIYERQKKYTEAERAFRKALELEKDNPAVLNYLGYMLADRGVKLDEAVSMIEKAVDQDPANGAYLDSLGWAYFRLNKLDLAEQYLTKALKFAASDPTVNDHVGDLYFKLQRFEEAKAAWTKSVQLSSDQEEIAKVKKKLDDLKNKMAKP
jgi:tetratricopeptide (TPR) repeat protein